MKHQFQEDSNFWVTLGKGQNGVLVLFGGLISLFAIHFIVPIFFKGAEWETDGDLIRNIGNTIIAFVFSYFVGAFVAMVIWGLGVFVIQEKEAGLKLAEADKVNFPKFNETPLFYVCSGISLLVGVITYALI